MAADEAPDSAPPAGATLPAYGGVYLARHLEGIENKQEEDRFKPAIMRAYQEAKGVYKVRRVAPAPFVSHCGLRLFLRRGSD